MKNKRILLTGATGFLGSHILDTLLSGNHNIAILKRSSSDTTRISNLLSKVLIYNIDEISLERIFNEFKPCTIIHTACGYGRNDESIFNILESNLTFGLKLLNEAVNNKVSTFINTDTLLPRYLSIYSLSKSHFSEWLKFYSNKIQIINFRIEHMYGIRDDKKKFIPWLIHEMLSKKGKIHLTSGLQKRDFIYVSDVVDAFCLVLKKNDELSSWNEFDVGYGEHIEVKQMILKIADALEKKNNLKIKERLSFGVIPYRQNELMVPIVNINTLTSLGWAPKISIEEGIYKILNEL